MMILDRYDVLCRKMIRNDILFGHLSYLILSTPFLIVGSIILTKHNVTKLVSFGIMITEFYLQQIRMLFDLKIKSLIRQQYQHSNPP